MSARVLIVEDEKNAREALGEVFRVVSKAEIGRASCRERVYTIV